MSYRTVVCLSFLFILYPRGVLAQTYTDRKVQTFRARENTSLDIANKYGKVHVVTWDKDSVKIEADLRISTNNFEKMTKLKGNISFEFTSTNNSIVAKTVFTNAAGIITDFVDAFIPPHQVNINYMVYVPKYIRLKITNKFGDIYLDDFDGYLDIVHSNGILKINEIRGISVISLSSCDGTINNIHGGRVIASYSDLRIREASNTKLETKSSRITVDKAGYLNVDSRRDRYQLLEINSISFKGYFTTINIDNLLKDLSCSMKYGTISLMQIDKSFSKIQINSEYTDMDLYFEKGSSYNIDITHSNDVHIIMPNVQNTIKTIDFDVALKLKKTSGKIGSSAQTLSELIISAPKKCMINIFHK